VGEVAATRVGEERLTPRVFSTCLLAWAGSARVREATTDEPSTNSSISTSWCHNFLSELIGNSSEITFDFF
jgi:hypothetical protein